MATGSRQGFRKTAAGRGDPAAPVAAPVAEPADWLADVDRRPPIPVRRSRDLSWLTRWLPDLDEPLRVAHEKSWGLMALAGATVAGGMTMIAFEQPEFDVWVAALMGALAGVLALPLLAILVRLGLVLLGAGSVAAAVWYFA